MGDLKDTGTLFIKKATDILTLHNPVKTALGVISGVGLETGSKAFRPYFAEVKWLDLSAIALWEYICFGLLVIYFVTTIKWIFKDNKFNQPIEDAFAAVDEIKKRGVKEKWEINNMYLDICHRVLDKIELDDNIKREITESNKKANEPTES